MQRLRRSEMQIHGDTDLSLRGRQRRFKINAVESLESQRWADGTKYPSRPLSPGEFRLIQLHPDKFGSPISCHLEIYELDVAFRHNQPPEPGWHESGAFEALSYTWGPSTENRTMRVNQTFDLPVTDNLWYALQRLRDTTATRALWIDAIAINQRDHGEKPHQVQNMIQIYRCARCVLVWLGESERRPLSGRPKGKRELVSAYQWHARRLLATVCARNFWNWANGGLPTRLKYLWQIVVTQGPFSNSFRKLESLSALEAALSATQDLWFERIWVVQEYCVAQRVHFMFGPSSFEESLETPSECPFANLMGQVSVVYGYAGRLERYLREMQEFQAGRLVRSTSDASEVLMRSREFRGLHATDPRDRVYGMLGLAPQEQADQVVVDYHRSCSQVLAQATFATILFNRNFDLLSQIKLDHLRRPELPSWAFDFHDLKYDPVDYISTGRSHRHRRDVVPVKLDAAWRLLTVRGQRFGKVLQAHRLTRREKNHSKDAVDQPRLRQDLALYRRHIAAALPEKSQQGVPSDRTGLTHNIEQVESLARRLYREFVQSSDCRLGPTKELYQYASTAADTLDAFIMDSGLFGFGPGVLEEGDSIILLRGSPLPIALHPCNDAWLFRGFVHVHGVVCYSRLPPHLLTGRHDLEAGIAPGVWRSAECDEDFTLA